jgi:hypothetical protein
MRILRHEAGHALGNAFRLHARRDWTDTFGSYRVPYPEWYQPQPDSRDYVLNLDAWYAQAHPAEDFAETFAIWLKPGARWRRQYLGWGAMRKLEYVDRIAHELCDVQPPRATGETDITVDEMEQTVEDFYREVHVDEAPIVENLALDTDLTDIFMTPESKRDDVEYRAARELLAEHRRDIADKVNYWTGVRRTLVRTLLLAIERRAEELELVAEVSRTRSHMIDLTVYVATLAMTFLTGARPLRHRK